MCIYPSSLSTSCVSGSIQYQQHNQASFIQLLHVGKVSAKRQLVLHVFADQLKPQLIPLVSSPLLYILDLANKAHLPRCPNHDVSVSVFCAFSFGPANVRSLCDLYKAVSSMSGYPTMKKTAEFAIVPTCCAPVGPILQSRRPQPQLLSKHYSRGELELRSLCLILLLAFSSEINARE